MNLDEFIRFSCHLRWLESDWNLLELGHFQLLFVIQRTKKNRRLQGVWARPLNPLLAWWKPGYLENSYKSWQNNNEYRRISRNFIELFLKGFIDYTFQRVDLLKLNLVSGFNHLETYDLVNGKDDPINYGQYKIKFMFEATNQELNDSADHGSQETQAQ